MLKQNARYKARVDAPRASSSNYNTHTVISGINKGLDQTNQWIFSIKHNIVSR